MSFAYGTLRPQISQDIITFPLTVPGVGQAIPISNTLDKTRLITSFTISNPVAGSSVYLGNQGVTNAGTTQGLEIPAGTAPTFRTFQEDRQLYELQVLLGQIAEQLKCSTPQMEKIPFICWDLTQLYLFSGNAAGSPVTVAAFPQMYL
jgi:hypothetical protein